MKINREDIMSKITPENLLENLEHLAGWPIYGLASQALEYYFPEKYKSELSVSDEVDLLKKLGLKFWDDVVIKYHTEVGFKKETLLTIHEK